MQSHSHSHRCFLCNSFFSVWWLWFPVCSFVWMTPVICVYCFRRGLELGWHLCQKFDCYRNFVITLIACQAYSCYFASPRQNSCLWEKMTVCVTIPMGKNDGMCYNTHGKKWRYVLQYPWEKNDGMCYNAHGCSVGLCLHYSVQAHDHSYTSGRENW